MAGRPVIFMNPEGCGTSAWWLSSKAATSPLCRKPSSSMAAAVCSGMYMYPMKMCLPR